MSEAASTELINRSVMVSGHRTSISIERVFWQSLREIARSEGRSINQIVGEIDAGRHGNLSSAVRVYVLLRLKAGAPASAAARRPSGG